MIYDRLSYPISNIIKSAISSRIESNLDVVTSFYICIQNPSNFGKHMSIAHMYCMHIKAIQCDIHSVRSVGLALHRHMHANRHSEIFISRMLKLHCSM